MASREALLRSGITKSDKIIEIGPSYNPLTPKAEGWNSYVLDHADQDGLINKYRGVPSVDISKIEPVDFVWTGSALSDAVPVEHHGTFDVLLASHVFEHVPDLVAVLRSAEVLCGPGGRMVLALPDKRVCFDFFRPLSTSGEVLAAHWEQRARHTAKTMWDHFAYCAFKRGDPGWGRTDQTPLSLAHSLEEAHALARQHDTKEYLDAHAWTFVPASFSLIMLELAHLRLTDWQVQRTQPAGSTEFYVWLRRGALAKQASLSQAELTAQRTTLLKEIMLELDDQGWQLGGRARSTLRRLLRLPAAAALSLHAAARSGLRWLKRGITVPGSQKLAPAPQNPHKNK
jgi:SAM-dependent methyltransferase